MVDIIWGSLSAKTGSFGGHIESSLPSFGFFVLLIAATIIATLGLLADSTAVVIGARIAAPLMNPILSGAFGVSTGQGVLIR